MGLLRSWGDCFRHGGSKRGTAFASSLLNVWLCSDHRSIPSRTPELRFRSMPSWKTGEGCRKRTRRDSPVGALALESQGSLALATPSYWPLEKRGRGFLRALQFYRSQLWTPCMQSWKQGIAPIFIPKTARAGGKHYYPIQPLAKRLKGPHSLSLLNLGLLPPMYTTSIWAPGKCAKA